MVACVTAMGWSAYLALFDLTHRPPAPSGSAEPCVVVVVVSRSVHAVIQEPQMAVRIIRLMAGRC